jgi:hypothetical protein
MISSQEVDDAVEILLKAEEIKKNKELMKEVEPAFQEKIDKLEEVKSLKGLWKQGLEKASAEEEKKKEEALTQVKLGDKKDDDEKEDEEEDLEKTAKKSKKELSDDDAD